MKILDSYIVKQNGDYQHLLYCGEGRFIITSTGAFGNRPMTYIAIAGDEAWKLIHESTASKNKPTP